MTRRPPQKRLTQDLQDKLRHVPRLPPRTRHRTFERARTAYRSTLACLRRDVEDLAWFYEEGNRNPSARALYYLAPISAVQRRGPRTTWMDKRHILEVADQLEAYALELEYEAQRLRALRDKAIESLDLYIRRPPDGLGGEEYKRPRAY